MTAGRGAPRPDAENNDRAVWHPARPFGSTCRVDCYFEGAPT